MPQSALISPPSLDLPRAPPPLDLQNLGLSPSSHEDADEQISKLLKNLHQQPGARKEDHKQPLPPAPAAASATPSSSLPTSTAPSLSTNPETELIKKLEVTGMASVAAARASEHRDEQNDKIKQVIY